MTVTIQLKVTEKNTFLENVELLDQAIRLLKDALAKAEPLAISDAAYRVIAPYDAMSEQATLIFHEMAASGDR
ncbi:hypothetical protein [Paracoccus sp. (in: a-proteobacteria)]|uniref:hypothetical protein n=1 Tax=Paracoccus sp. TaxID=267 RepID=UPI002898A95F|nr:hypothetical protein [Paracoccus sp. (in: a-proteobacteria)]